MSDKLAIICDEINPVCDKLAELGYKVIPTDKLDCFISYEQRHADLQSICVNDTVFVLSECKNLIEQLKKHSKTLQIASESVKSTYPDNVKLNAKIVSDLIIGKISALDSSFVQFCKNAGYKFVDVKQGYSACSIAKVSDNAIITADNSIAETLVKYDVDVLKISPGNIVLHNSKGEEYGFIGGASALIDTNTLLFFGDLSSHPDKFIIRKFCDKHHTKIIDIKGFKLTDIGGTIYC